jgi:outer membrane protein OmpA-like peptidoglycan-associated protein
VVDYLVGKGAPADALTAKGLGEEQVLDTSETPEGHARNRRTEFKVAARPS